MAKRTITISLDSEADWDLLRWLDSQENRSAAVREAIRADMRGDVSNREILRAVEALERKIGAGAVRLAVDDWIEEPIEAVTALDRLAELA